MLSNAAPDAAPRRSLAAELTVWLTKALITRNHPKSIQTWTDLQNQLKTAPMDAALHLANEFRILFKDTVYLSNVRLIYKQKFFNLNLPTLIASLKVPYFDPFSLIPLPLPSCLALYTAPLRISFGSQGFHSIPSRSCLRFKDLPTHHS